MNEPEFPPSDDEIEDHMSKTTILANRRYPGLATLIEEAIEGLYALLGDYHVGEGEVEGPERLQEYSGFTDEMMTYLFHQDAPNTTFEDVMAAESEEGVEARVDDAFAEHANLLKVMGDLFHWAAAMEMPLPEE